MANYANLKATINANIKANGNEEITGPILNTVLNQAVTTLGDGWSYKGIATPSMSPGTPDSNVFYIATTAGTYTNFGSLVVADGEVAILKYNGSWAKEVTGAATAAQVTQLGQEINNIPYTMIDGKCIRPSGSVSNDNSQFYTKPIKVHSGEVLSYKVAGYNTAVLSLYNNGTYTPVVTTPSSVTVIQDTYTVDADGYVVFSGLKNSFNLLLTSSMSRIDREETNIVELQTEIDGIKSDIYPQSVTGELSATKDLYLRIYGNYKAGNVLYISVKAESGVSVNRPFSVFQDTISSSIATIPLGSENVRVVLPSDSSVIQLYMYRAGVTSGGDATFTMIKPLRHDIDEIEPLKDKLETFDEINGQMSESSGTMEIGISGKFIYTDGSLTNNASYDISEVITLEKLSIIKFQASGAAGVVSVLSRVSNGTYTPLILAESTSIKEYEYQNEFGEDIQVVICSSLLDTYGSYTILSGGKIAQIGDLAKLETLQKQTIVSAINEVNSKLPSSVPTNYDGGDIGIFAKGVCIGDSLTSGTFNYNDAGTTQYIDIPKYSYPSKLSEMLGIDIVNLGRSGDTSVAWYEAMEDEDLSGYDFAIIQLGVNDYYRLGGWTQASITAFTNIITKLKTENTNIKIFVATVMPAASYSSVMGAISQGIRDLVANINDPNVILIDMALYGHTNDSLAYNCGHLSAYGYWRLAKDYYNYISWYIHNNPMVFREVQFIGTNLSYQ